MTTPSAHTIKLRLRAIAALALTLAAAATLTPAAGAYVTPGQAADAAQRGANWFRAEQSADGSLSSDWAITALAAAGISAADVRTAALNPSAQDYYVEDWRNNGPGTQVTDAARGILAASAGGIQPSRLSAAAAAERSNLVARLGELYDGAGEQFGAATQTNDDIFAILALHRAGAPAELLRAVADHVRAAKLEDGGWNWYVAPGATSDADMTSTAVAALCAAGADPATDPDVRSGLAFLRTAQDPASGGFEVAPAMPWSAVNTDTTGWVASGLIQCGLDPQSAEWTTSAGKTPFDYLLAMQQPAGYFNWQEGVAGATVMSTFDAVRPLAGAAWSALPPQRLDGRPAVREADPVDDGTVVPLTLVIDHGAPGSGGIRMCRVDAEAGSTAGEVLAAAQTASTPAGCVSEIAAAGGALSSLNGIEAPDDWEWRVGVGVAASTDGLGERVGQGDLVFAQLAAAVPDPRLPAVPEEPAPMAPPASAPATGAAGFAKARLARGGRLRLSRRGLLVPVRCPRAGSGCRGTVTLRLRAGRRATTIGRAAFALRPGQTRTLRVGVRRSLRKRLARAGRLRVLVVTRGEDGALRVLPAGRGVVAAGVTRR